MNQKLKGLLRRLSKTKQGRRVIAVMAIIAVILGIAYALFPERIDRFVSSLGLGDTAISKDAEVSFHFIDVGQGDATLIVTDEVHILVDCGIYDYHDELAEYIKKYTDKLDLFVFSHAHDDHMGGAAAIINSFEVSEVLMTEYDSDSAFYGRAIDAIEDREVKVTEAVAGNTYKVGDVNIDVLGPMKDYGDANNNSIIMRVEADGVSAMFSGDAEKTPEADVAEKYGSALKCDIMKAGHHGSSTSNTRKFIDLVDPEYAVVSCGKDNSYGHPHREIRAMYKEMGIKWYRTDESGTVVIEAIDGKLQKK